MNNLLFVSGCIFILLGVVFFALAVLGIFKFKYVLNRMHAAAICDGLALGLCLCGLICFVGLNAIALKFVVLIGILFFTSPISAHMIVNYEIETNENLEKDCEVPKR